MQTQESNLPDDLKPIALYYQVRSKYRHPIIYNRTLPITSITGLHPKTIQRYLKKLSDHVEWELVEWRDVINDFLGEN